MFTTRPALADSAQQYLQHYSSTAAEALQSVFKLALPNPMSHPSGLPSQTAELTSSQNFAHASAETTSNSSQDNLAASHMVSAANHHPAQLYTLPVAQTTSYGLESISDVHGGVTLAAQAGVFQPDVLHQITQDCLSVCWSWCQHHFRQSQTYWQITLQKLSVPAAVQCIPNAVDSTRLKLMLLYRNLESVGTEHLKVSELPLASHSAL